MQKTWKQGIRWRKKNKGIVQNVAVSPKIVILDTNFVDQSQSNVIESIVLPVLIVSDYRYLPKGDLPFLYSRYQIQCLTICTLLVVKLSHLHLNWLICRDVKALKLWKSSWFNGGVTWQHFSMHPIQENIQCFTSCILWQFSSYQFWDSQSHLPNIEVL